jgi:hypothetical protein
VKLVALDLLSMGIKSMALHIIVVDMLPGLAPIWSRMHAYTCVRVIAYVRMRVRDFYVSMHMCVCVCVIV